MKVVRFEQSSGKSIEAAPGDDKDVRIEVIDDDGDQATIWLPCAEARELAAYVIEMADKAEAGAQ